MSTISQINTNDESGLNKKASEYTDEDIERALALSGTLDLGEIHNNNDVVSSKYVNNLEFTYDYDKDENKNFYYRQKGTNKWIPIPNDRNNKFWQLAMVHYNPEKYHLQHPTQTSEEVRNKVFGDSRSNSYVSKNWTDYFWALSDEDINRALYRDNLISRLDGSRAGYRDTYIKNFSDDPNAANTFDKREQEWMNENKDKLDFLKANGIDAERAKQAQEFIDNNNQQAAFNQLQYTVAERAKRGLYSNDDGSINDELLAHDLETHKKSFDELQNIDMSNLIPLLKKTYGQEFEVGGINRKNGRASYLRNLEREKKNFQNGVTNAMNEAGNKIFNFAAGLTNIPWAIALGYADNKTNGRGILSNALDRTFNGTSGAARALFGDKWAEEHPWLATATNILGDPTMLATGALGLGKAGKAALANAKNGLYRPMLNLEGLPAGSQKIGSHLFTRSPQPVTPHRAIDIKGVLGFQQLGAPALKATKLRPQGNGKFVDIQYQAGLGNQIYGNPNPNLPMESRVLKGQIKSPNTSPYLYKTTGEATNPAKELVSTTSGKDLIPGAVNSMAGDFDLDLPMEDYTTYPKMEMPKSKIAIMAKQDWGSKEFQDAFAKAREKGLKSFYFKGKKYGTNLGNGNLKLKAVNGNYNNNNIIMPEPRGKYDLEIYGYDKPDIIDGYEVNNIDLSPYKNQLLNDLDLKNENGWITTNTFNINGTPTYNLGRKKYYNRSLNIPVTKKE